MLGWLPRWFRSDPYYTSYERSFERLEKEQSRVEVRGAARRARRGQTRRTFSSNLFYLAAVLTAAAGAYASWVHQLPEGTYTAVESAVRTSAVFVIPCLAAIWYSLVTGYLMWREGRDIRKLEHLNKARMHMLKDLKDRANFEKISALVQKYDPEERNKSMAGQTSRSQNAETRPGHRRRSSHSNKSVPVAQPPQSGGNASLAYSAGKMLFPVLDHLATSIMGDSPELLNELRELRESVTQMQDTIAHLTSENFQLRGELARVQQGSSLEGSSGGPAPDPEGRPEEFEPAGSISSGDDGEEARDEPDGSPSDACPTSPAQNDANGGIVGPATPD
eukprot:evm.model.scf_1302.6 EVM.evm.TU.scf_1302.6   scf_1302:26161-30720(+)